MQLFLLPADFALKESAIEAQVFDVQPQHCKEDEHICQESMHPLFQHN
jgi:hypothetical protein